VTRPRANRLLPLAGLEVTQLRIDYGLTSEGWLTVAEWTAVGQSEEDCIREMARCLREIGEGRARR